jgi:hypothetical protein
MRPYLEKTEINWTLNVSHVCLILTSKTKNGKQTL